MTPLMSLHTPTHTHTHTQHAHTHTHTHTTHTHTHTHTHTTRTHAHTHTHNTHTCTHTYTHAGGCDLHVHETSSKPDSDLHTSLPRWLHQIDKGTYLGHLPPLLSCVQYPLLATSSKAKSCQFRQLLGWPVVAKNGKCWPNQPLPRLSLKFANSCIFRIVGSCQIGNWTYLPSYQALHIAQLTSDLLVWQEPKRKDNVGLTNFSTEWRGWGVGRKWTFNPIHCQKLRTVSRSKEIPALTPFNSSPHND